METKNAYLKELKELEKTVKDMECQKKGIKKLKSSKKVIASALFDKLLVTAKSYLKLLPFSSLHGSEEDDWDLSSIATLTRNIIENYNIFFYLIVDKVPKDEEYFRILLCELHSDVERLKMYNSLKVEKEIVKKQREKINKIKDDIYKNTFYKSLDWDDRNELIKGKRPLYLSGTQINKKIDLDISNEEIEFVYRFTSNYIHSSPFSIHDIEENEETDIIYITELLEVVNKYLKQAILDYKKLFQGIFAKYIPGICK